MFQAINDELMSCELAEIYDKRTEKTFTKIKIISSGKIQQYEGSNYNSRSKIHPQPSTRSFNIKETTNNSAQIVSKVEKLRPLNREILRVAAPIKEIEEFTNCTEKKLDFDLPMSIFINRTIMNQPLVEIRCHEQGEDRANIFLVAFPFNGMIQPIKEDPRYRIYKGMIVSSAKPFFFNNRRYRKVLYLIIEPNKNLFNPTHKYHTDVIDIKLESFALFDDRETGLKKTNHETYILNVRDPDGTYDDDWTYEVIDEAVIMTCGENEPLWPTFTFPNKPAYSTPGKFSRPNQGYRGDKYKKPQVVGDTMVTTNKHGIRKETSIGTKNHPKRDIDEMIKSSGINENQKRSYDNTSYNKGSKGKKKNYRRDY
jgi:hypothetical protein